MANCVDCKLLGNEVIATTRTAGGTFVCLKHYDQRKTAQTPAPFTEERREVRRNGGTVGTIENLVHDTARKVKEGIPVAKKICKCGCGTEMDPEGSHDYVRGHKTASVAKKPDSGRIAVYLSEEQLDGLWKNLPVSRKAELLSGL